MLRPRLRFVRILTLIAVFLALTRQGTAVDETVSTSVNITASSIFSAEFYTDQNVIYSTTSPFSNIDPTKSMVYPVGRAENDGKSDTGVVCVDNTGETWYLKIHGSFSEGLPENSVLYYFSQPWNRNTGAQTGGTLTYTTGWRPLPKEPATVYTSGSGDTVNTPFGTLSTFSFAVDPKGLEADHTYTISITYTMTNTP